MNVGIVFLMVLRRQCLGINFFWYKLKKVGPYKLKGFQFIGERIKLKEGKKPFK